MERYNPFAEKDVQHTKRPDGKLVWKIITEDRARYSCAEKYLIFMGYKFGTWDGIEGWIFSL